MNTTEKRERYRRVLAGDVCIHPASVFDPTSARIADSLGYEIGMLAGSVAAAAVLGSPDLVVLTLTEFADLARRITRASDLSLMVDADHGYGNALSVMRTVEELEVAGVSALTIEDTLLPAPFGRQSAQDALPVEEMVGKLRAAVAARSDPSLVVIGRTRVSGDAAFAETVERVRTYSTTGVDAIFVAGATTRAQVQAVHGATDLPLLLGGTPPDLNDQGFLSANRVRIALTGHIPFWAAVKTVFEVFQQLKDDGVTATVRERAASEELMALATGRQEYAGWQQEFLS